MYYWQRLSDLHENYLYLSIISSLIEPRFVVTIIWAIRKKSSESDYWWYNEAAALVIVPRDPWLGWAQQHTHYSPHTSGLSLEQWPGHHLAGKYRQQTNAVCLYSFIWGWLTLLWHSFSWGHTESPVYTIAARRTLLSAPVTIRGPGPQPHAAITQPAHNSYTRPLIGQITALLISHWSSYWCISDKRDACFYVK